MKCLNRPMKAPPTGHILLIKFLSRTRHRGASSVSPSNEKSKKFLWPAYLTRGGMGPIPGFAFQGRKSFRLAAAAGGDRGKRLLHGRRQGSGPGNKVPIRKGYQHAKRRKEKCGDRAVIATPDPSWVINPGAKWRLGFYHSRRWYVHEASTFPLAHHYRAVLAWGP